MRIPEKVKMGGLTYDITYSTKPSRGDVEVDGKIIYSEQSIIIRSGLNEGDEYKEYVLLHELVHGIFNFFDIEQHEGYVDKIARGLHMLIKDNPEMFKEDDKCTK